MSSRTPPTHEGIGDISRCLGLLVVIALLFVSTAGARLSPTRLRQLVYRSHPCLAHIIDQENGRWDPTISFGGGHNVNDSYGLGQANPGTKMASFGADWRTNPWTQIRWALAYSNRYGGECGAWSFWQRNHYW